MTRVMFKKKTETFNTFDEKDVNNQDSSKVKNNDDSKNTSKHENFQSESDPSNRVHKNSMEEWEQRLTVPKKKISAVDRIIEKNTCDKNQNVELKDKEKKSCLEKDKSCSTTKLAR